MITERLMELGAWDLTLREDTPWEIRQQVYRGDQIRVYASRIPDGTSSNLSGIPTLYRGIVVGHSQDRSRFHGANLLWLIQSASKIGRVITHTGGGPTFFTFASHLSWITSQHGDNLGGLGWIATTGGTPQTPYPEVADEWERLPRNVLDRLREIAANCGASWRPGNLGRFYYGSADSPNLHAGYDTTPPNVLITDTGHGSDITIYGLDHTTNGDVDIDDFADRAVIAAPSSAWAAYNRAGAPYIPNAAGTPAYRTLIDASPSESNNDANARAKAAVTEHGQRSHLDVTIHTPQPREFINPGDRIGVYLPAYGYVSDTETVTYQGRQIRPMRVQTIGLTWPIEPGMSVYTVDATGTRPPVDLSEWVVPDTQPARLELGAPAKWLRLPLR